MDRTLALLAAIVAVPFVAIAAYNLANDPTTEQREWIAAQQAVIPSPRDDDESGKRPVWMELVASRPSAWESIVPPPPPPPKKIDAPPPCVNPDMAKLLDGVRPTKSQIGDRIKIITPQSERGEWFVAGDVINNCVISTFDRLNVTFTIKSPCGDTLTRVLARGDAMAKPAPRESAEQQPPPGEKRREAPPQDAPPAKTGTREKPRGKAKPGAKPEAAPEPAPAAAPVEAAPEPAAEATEPAAEAPAPAAEPESAPHKAKARRAK